MVDRSVVRAKVATIQVRLRELKSRRDVRLEEFSKNMATQAIILHNYQIAIQACCDLASHIVADQELGIPGVSADLFEFMAQAKIIPWPLAERLKKHVGLRNLIVHAYDKLDYAEIHATLQERIRDTARFLRLVAAYAKL